MTQRQNFDVTPGTDWAISLILSIGRHVKFDALASIKILTPASKNLTPPRLCENPHIRRVAVWAPHNFAQNQLREKQNSNLWSFKQGFIVTFHEGCRMFNISITTSATTSQN